MRSQQAGDPETMSPILVHGDGFALWGNRAFVARFGIDPAGAKRMKVRELLWCLGIQDPVAGMIAGGAVFRELEVALLGEAKTQLVRLRQNFLPDDASQPRMMLVMEDGLHHSVGQS